MEKAMRKMPTIAVMVALVIQVGRVAGFGNRIGAGVLAWVFAFFLAGSIYGLSYWDGRAKYTVTADPEDKRSYAAQMRIKRASDEARNEARLWLVVFVAIDGGLNLAETMTDLPAGISGWQYAGAIIYGVFPTLAALGLGRLQAYIERIPTISNTSKSWIDKLIEWRTRDKQPQQVAPATSKGNSQSDKQPEQLPQQGEQVAGATSKQPEAIARKDEQQDDKQPVQVEALLAYWRDNPKASDKQVADKFGVKRQAIQQRRTELIRKGDIRLTDRGIEIVGTPVQMQEVRS